jgi:hypothetical protein
MSAKAVAVKRIGRSLAGTKTLAYSNVNTSWTLASFARNWAQCALASCGRAGRLIATSLNTFILLNPSLDLGAREAAWRREQDLLSPQALGQRDQQPLSFFGRKLPRSTYDFLKSTRG